MKIKVTEHHETNTDGTSFDFVKVETSEGTVYLQRCEDYDRDLVGCKPSCQDSVREFASYEAFREVGYINANKVVDILDDDTWNKVKEEKQAELATAKANGEKEHYCLADGTMYDLQRSGFWKARENW